jgi:hypothetical protein
MYPSIRRGLPTIDRRFWWIGFGLLTLLLRWLCSLNPYFTEVVYSRGVFLGVRWVWDYTLGWLPLPWLYLAAPLLLGWLVWQGWRNVRRHRHLPVLNRLARALLGLLSFLGLMITLFFFLWGFNYYRRSIEDHLRLPTQPLTNQALVQEFQQATADLMAAYADRVGPADSALTEATLPPDLETTTRDALVQALGQLDYPTPGRVRGRFIYPEGLLIQLGASGIYIPYVGEGHVDAALPAASRPFTLAHEMAHGYGFADEGTCNFLALLACEASTDPVMRYTGRLAYWRHVATAYRRLDADAYAQLRATLPAGIVADLEAVNAVYLRYRGFFPDVSATVYDAYLKGQGISEGLANYDQVLNLVVAWRRQQPGSLAP